MFEFLNGYEDNKLYDAGLEIENQLHSKLVFAAMRSLSEYVLFSMYEKYGNDIYGVRLVDLLKDSSFTSRISRDIHFVDFQTLDEICRLGGNHALHINKNFTFDLTQSDVKKGFKCVYDLIGKYYKYMSKNNAPQWVDEKYDELLRKASDPEARKKIEKEYSEKLSEKETELARAKKDAKEREKETKRLECELEKLKKASVDGSVLESFESKIKELEKINNDIDSQSIILKRKLAEAMASKDNIQEKLTEIELKLSRKQGLEAEFAQQLKIEQEKYQKLLQKSSVDTSDILAKNDKLEEQLIEVKKEKELLKQQLEFAEMSAVDKEQLQELKLQIENAQSSEKAAKEKLSSLELTVDDLRDKLYISNSKTDKIYYDYCESQKEINKLYDTQDEYKKEIDYLTEFIEDHNQNAPRCPRCKSALTPRNRKDGSKMFWGCPNYPSCSFARDMEPSEMTIAKKILRLKGQRSEDWDKYKAQSESIKQLKTKKWGIDRSQIERLKKKYIQYSQYPESIRTDSTYLFESLEVPNSIFTSFERTTLSAFSRFKMVSNLPSSFVDEKEKLIYSLTLKLLNRGIVNSKNEKYSNVLREKFNDNCTGELNSLFDYQSYSNPINKYDSDSAESFADSVFSKIFGDSWATYVLVNPQLDLLLSEDDWGNFSGQSVSFCFWSKGKKIVIDIDKDVNSEQLKYSALGNEQYKIVPIKTKGVSDYETDAINQINTIIGDNSGDKLSIDCDEKYAVSCKLSHQLSILLVKALETGMIGQHSNIEITGENKLFSESELKYILTIASEEAKEIIDNFAELYDIEFDLDFFDSTLESVLVDIGGNTNSDIFIRDMYIPSNYLCEIEPLSLKYLPNKTSEKALVFFLKYLFGYDRFRDGQLAALNKVLNQKDSVVLLPTGAGKSIIYQLASFILPGMIIVISPLNSLIEDQLSNLESRYGINNAISITSATSNPEIQKSLTAIMMSHNSTALLYISPERLQIPSFRKSVEDLLNNNNVCAIAIDEAHCVSEWGHDFRPAYLNIGDVSRRIFKKNNYIPSILALTGTASDAVLSDVQRDLNIHGEDSLILPETFDREELNYSICNCSAMSKTAKISDIIKNQLPGMFGESYDSFAKRNGDKTNSGIIFTPIARNSSHPTEYDAFSMQLRLMDRFPELGVDCYFSTAPDDFDEDSWKEKIRESARKFKNNEINLLVATKAYGMGIDKSNIRYTIHDGLPSSIEQFYQEAGRAGRDRNHSECILVFSNDNADFNEEMLNPALSIDEFLEKYEEYQKKYKFDGKDDLSSALFFHTGNFKGVSSECESIEAIINNIANNSNFSEDVTVDQLLLKKDRQSKNDAEKEWLQSLIRLSILGVVKNYTYDYCGHFQITFGSLEKEKIAYQYGQYVSGIDKGKARIEVEKINNLKSTGWSLVKEAVRILVEYIYDKIEKGRRAALRSMFQMAKQAAAEPIKNQNNFIRNEVLHYLALKSEARNELENIRDSLSAGWEEIENVLPLYVDEIVADNEERIKANKVKGAVGRMIESSADHPGLLILRAIAEIKTGNYEIALVANDINAAFRFAKERKIDEELRRNVIVKVLNLALNSSVDLYEKIVEQITEFKTVSKEELQNELISSNDISDTNREYILLDMISNKLYERL